MFKFLKNQKKEITAVSGEKILVDKEDYGYLKNFNWYVTPGGYTMTSMRIEKGQFKNVYMHRLIMEPHGLGKSLLLGQKLEVDHINHNPLDNRKENLRLVTKQMNLMNKKPYRKNKLGLKGVLQTKSGKFKAQITYKGKTEYIGLFETKEEAAMAYNRKAKAYFGEYANLNNVGELK